PGPPGVVALADLPVPPGVPVVASNPVVAARRVPAGAVEGGAKPLEDRCVGRCDPVDQRADWTRGGGRVQAEGDDAPGRPGVVRLAEVRGPLSKLRGDPVRPPWMAHQKPGSRRAGRQQYN